MNIKLKDIQAITNVKQYTQPFQDKARSNIMGLEHFTLLCGIFPCIYAMVYCSLYFYMWEIAKEYQSYKEEMMSEIEPVDGIETPVPEVPFYDQCGNLDMSDTSYTTNWTVILAFNSSLYLILAISSFCL